MLLILYTVQCTGQIFLRVPHLSLHVNIPDGMGPLHRRRIYSEEKAKVVDAVFGGQNLFNSLLR